MKTIAEKELREIIKDSLKESVPGKVGAVGLAAALGLGPLNQSCTPMNEPDIHTTNYQPQWEHEGQYTEQELQERTWNTHNERGDWNNVGPGEGFIYECKTRCRGGWNVWVIFADKKTGWYVLPQDCKEFLYGRYMPNANCFENENTTDRINTNGLTRMDSDEDHQAPNDDENTIYLEENKMKLTETQLRKIIKDVLLNL